MRETPISRISLISFAIAALATSPLFAGQGVQRMLYTVPNATFIENPSGDSVVTINDTSGSISSLQTSINNARSGNPNSIIVIHLLRGATYSVSSAGLVLGANECLVGSGAIIQAANSSVTVPLITISSGSTNVSVAGGTLDGNGANINGITAPAAARVNIDKVVVRNCGLDCILLKGNGNTTFDNEMTVTRCDVSGSPNHAGISIQNCTQAAILDNNCHNNSTGIWLSCAWANVANNTCQNNTTGIDANGGNDNVIANNTCNSNGTGIHAGGTKNMIVSDSMGNNSTAGISSTGTSNNFIDNLFTSGNAVNFSSAGTSDNIVAYGSPVSASGENYFYPPLIDNQHTVSTIVNGMGRSDLTIGSTTIDSVQSQYNAARSANPNNVIVLHLTGSSYTVGATPLTLSANTCVLLSGTIQINSSTAASAAVTAASGTQANISLSGGIIDGGNLTGNNGINISGASMIQVDNMTLQHFGPDNPRAGGSDVIHFSGGSTPYIVTRCTINGGAARGIWLQLSGQKSLISDNEVTAVNMDGVDCDSSTFGAVVKFNYCHDLVRYGVFFEQSATHDLALGNTCNNDGRDINLYNNSTTPRGPTAYNNVLCNALMSNNGLRNGSTGDGTAVATSDNFIFNNTVVNASISSESFGTNNYYSQNYRAGGSLSTSGAENFFNSTDVDGNLQVLDSNSGLAVIAQNAATTNGTSIVTAQPNSMGNGTGDDEWQFIPTDSGFYQVKNKNSGLAMVVQGASTNNGAPIVQFAYSGSGNDEWLIQSVGNGLYNFINRLSGLNLDVTGASRNPGTQLDQWPDNGNANQQFSFIEDTPSAGSGDFSMATTPASQSVTPGNGANYTVTVTPSNNFSGVVTFSVSGLPNGGSANFNPTSVTGSGNSTLSVSTSASTPGGTYTLTIVGTSGSLSHTNTVNLAVSDFTVSATPSSQTVQVGNNTSYTVNLGNVNGFSGSIALTAGGLSTGAGASFNPASLTAPGSSTMTVTTTGSTPAANSTLSITGTSGSLAHSTGVTLQATDFSLAATPASQSVIAGNNTTFTVTVSALNGFNGTVTFGAVSGLPAGASASFNPTTVTGAGSSTLTIAASTSTAAGTYTLTIPASSGGQTHNVTVTLQVTDFSLSASPSSLTITQGNNGTSTITVNPVNGFNGSVALSASGLPSGVTASFNPSSTTTTSTLTLTASGTAATGTVTVTVTGTIGSLSHNTTISLTVQAAGGGLPTGWTDTDIGAVGMGGSASYNNGTFTVSGSGSDIWTAADQFNYAYQSVSGDQTVIARVVSESGTQSFAKAAVMIRETLATNSVEASTLLTPTNGVAMEVRPTTGAATINLSGWITGPKPPQWLKLVRSGSTFTASYSADGNTWTQIATTNVTMATSATAGLAVTAHSNTNLNTANFDNVSIAGPAPNFTLSASPSSLTVTQGNNGTSTITVNPINGFNGSVSLSASGLPSGVTASFNPTSTTSTSTLTLTVSGTAATGTATVTVKGVSGSLTNTTTISLTVNAAISFSGVYQLQNEASSLYLNNQGSLTNGSAITQWTASTSTNLDWTFITTSNGYYQINSAKSGLDAVVQSASTTNGAGIIQFAFGSAGNDQWKPVSNSDGSFTFFNLKSGLVLGDPGSSTNKTTQMDQETSTGGNNQKWTLIKQ